MRGKFRERRERGGGRDRARREKEFRREVQGKEREGVWEGSSGKGERREEGG